ncbi:hypothetical protein MRX96_001161 [Rhipicephalus microplus]
MDHSGEDGAKSSDAPFAAVGMTEDQIERQSQRRAAAVACRHFGPCQPLLADDISGAQRGGTASDHFQPTSTRIGGAISPRLGGKCNAVKVDAARASLQRKCQKSRAATIAVGVGGSSAQSRLRTVVRKKRRVRDVCMVRARACAVKRSVRGAEERCEGYV